MIASAPSKISADSGQPLGCTTTSRAGMACCSWPASSRQPAWCSSSAVSVALGSGDENDFGQRRVCGVNPHHGRSRTECEQEYPPCGRAGRLRAVHRIENRRHAMCLQVPGGSSKGCFTIPASRKAVKRLLTDTIVATATVRDIPPHQRTLQPAEACAAKRPGLGLHASRLFPPRAHAATRNSGLQT